ncbi:MAG: hypothetical protein GEU99_15310 [Luteitalea sp.]|nr:hypothetical protein [Luteitalea sp.]
MAVCGTPLLRRCARLSLVLVLLLVGPAGPLSVVHAVGDSAPVRAGGPIVCDTAHHTPSREHPPSDCAICHALYLLRWQPTAGPISLIVDLTRKLPFSPNDERSERHRPDAPAPSRAPPVQA